MKLNELIAQAFNKPVEALTAEDVNKALLTPVRQINPVGREVICKFYVDGDNFVIYES